MCFKFYNFKEKNDPFLLILPSGKYLFIDINNSNVSAGYPSYLCKVQDLIFLHQIILCKNQVFDNDLRKKPFEIRELRNERFVIAHLALPFL